MIEYHANVKCWSTPYGVDDLNGKEAYQNDQFIENECKNIGKDTIYYQAVQYGGSKISECISQQ